MPHQGSPCAGVTPPPPRETAAGPGDVHYDYSDCYPTAAEYGHYATRSAADVPEVPSKQMSDDKRMRLFSTEPNA